MARAFALRAEYAKPFEEGGLDLNCTIAAGEQDVRIGDLLGDQHDGVAVVPDEDSALLAQLEVYPPLKEVGMPQDPDGVVVADRFSHLTKAQLHDELDRLGVDYKAGDKVEDLRQLVRDTTLAGDEEAAKAAAAADEAAAAGAGTDDTQGD